VVTVKRLQASYVAARSQIIAANGRMRLLDKTITMVPTGWEDIFMLRLLLTIAFRPERTLLF
jgi:hypothetical protein